MKEYIGITQLSRFNDDNHKKIIINRLFRSQDISNIIKDYVFIDAKTKYIKEKMKSVIDSIIFASISTRRDNDMREYWLFCANKFSYYESQFQAINCKFCGDYVFTRNTLYSCAENAKCDCVVSHMFGNTYFNWSYNQLIES
jgi:hypothetical protein